MRAATEGSLPPVMPQGNLVEVLGREVRQGSPGQLMVESTPSRQRRPPCKTNKEESDEAADAAALTYLPTYHSLNHLFPEVFFVGCPLTRCSRAILTASSTTSALWRTQYTWHYCRAQTSSAIHCTSSHIYMLVGRETGLALCLCQAAIFPSSTAGFGPLRSSCTTSPLM